MSAVAEEDANADRQPERGGNGRGDQSCDGATREKAMRPPGV